MIFNTYKDYLNDIKNFDDRTTYYGINKNPFHKQLEDSISFYITAMIQYYHHQD